MSLPLEAYVIAGLTAAAFVFGIVVVVLRGNAMQPTTRIGAIGVRFLEGAAPPWDGLLLVLRVLDRELRKAYPKEAPGFLRALWIEVLPAGAPIHGPLIKGDGEGIGGTPDAYRPYVVSGRIWVARVNQGRYLGVTENAVESAIVHEVVKHLLSLELGHGLNAGHLDVELERLAKRIEAEIRAEG